MTTNVAKKALKTYQVIGIEQIPLFVLALILSKTGFEMMSKLKLVSKRWNKATSKNSFYMAMLEDYCSKNMIITKFKIQEAKYPLIPKHFQHHSWRDIFQLKRQAYKGENKKLGTQIIEYPLMKSIKYEGELKSDEANGWGRLLISSGYSYEGEFKADLYHGRGKAISPNGHIYEGQWKNDKKHGVGKYTYANGVIYQGEWKNNQRHGRGKMIYLNGEIDEGEWKNNEKIVVIQKKNPITNVLGKLLLHSKSLITSRKK